LKFKFYYGNNSPHFLVGRVDIFHYPNWHELRLNQKSPSSEVISSTTPKPHSELPLTQSVRFSLFERLYLCL
jgi:hypothetical protein